MQASDGLKMGRLTREGVDALFKRRRVASGSTPDAIDESPFTRTVCAELGAADPLLAPSLPRSVRVLPVRDFQAPFESKLHVRRVCSDPHDPPAAFLRTPLAFLAAAALRPVWWPCRFGGPCEVAMPIVLVRGAPCGLLREIERCWRPLDRARYDGTNVPVCGVLASGLLPRVTTLPPRRHGPTVVFLDPGLDRVCAHDVVPGYVRLLEVSVAEDVMHLEEYLRERDSDWSQVSRALCELDAVDVMDDSIDLLFDGVLRGAPLGAGRLLSGSAALCRTHRSCITVRPAVDWLSTG